MNISRRNILTKGGVVAAAALAGCSSSSVQDGSGESLENVAMPSVDAKFLAGWSPAGTDNQTFSTTGVSGGAKTQIYDNTALRQAVKEKTMGSFDQPLAMAFASHIDLEGLATALASPKKIADEVEPTLKEQMTVAGIKNVRSAPVGSIQPSYPGHKSTVREYQGEFTVPKFEQTTEINGEERAISLDGGMLPVTGLLSVWKAKSGVAFAAGGAFPSADYERSDRISVTGEIKDGIDVGIFVDLNLNPDQLRRSVVRIAENVQRS